jgi:uncharacterized protein involved in type VI secretion and phage assembly
VNDLVTNLARELQSQRYGKYRGFVSDNKDPENLGRLRLRVPALLGEEVTAWALPCLPFGGQSGHGFFTLPEIDAQVWVEFEAGDISKPIWTGTFWQASGDAPVDDQSEHSTRIFKTPKGHLIKFEDADDEEQVRIEHSTSANMDMDKNGTVALTDGGGAVVKLDAENGEIQVADSNGNTMTLTASGVTLEDSNGNKIEMAASGIKLKGQQIVVEGTQVMLGGQGGEPMIKGQSFLTLFATHMHPTAMGPSGPPIPQGEMSSLSTKVMTS